MLKKKERLTKKEFDRFFSSPKKIHTPLLAVVYTKADDFHGAVVVGKKVYPSAVARNRLRRQLYNILYRLSREKGLRGVYIILTKPAARNVSFVELKDTLTEVIQTIK